MLPERRSGSAAPLRGQSRQDRQPNVEQDRRFRKGIHRQMQHSSKFSNSTYAINEGRDC